MSFLEPGSKALEEGSLESLGSPTSPWSHARRRLTVTRNDKTPKGGFAGKSKGANEAEKRSRYEQGFKKHVQPPHFLMDTSERQKADEEALKLLHSESSWGAFVENRGDGTKTPDHEIPSTLREVQAA